MLGDGNDRRAAGFDAPYGLAAAHVAWNGGTADVPTRYAAARHGSDGLRPDATAIDGTADVPSWRIAAGYVPATVAHVQSGHATQHASGHVSTVTVAYV